jgi:hypothetical protein
MIDTSLRLFREHAIKSRRVDTPPAIHRNLFAAPSTAYQLPGRLAHAGMLDGTHRHQARLQEAPQHP